MRQKNLHEDLFRLRRRSKRILLCRPYYWDCKYIRLYSPSSIKPLVSQISKMLSLLYYHIAEDQPHSYTKEAAQFCQDLLTKINEIKSEISAAEKQKEFFKFTKIKRDINQIRLLIDENEDFSKFTKEFSWDCVASFISSNHYTLQSPFTSSDQDYKDHEDLVRENKDLLHRVEVLKRAYQRSQEEKLKIEGELLNLKKNKSGSSLPHRKVQKERTGLHRRDLEEEKKDLRRDRPRRENPRREKELVKKEGNWIIIEGFDPESAKVELSMNKENDQYILSKLNFYRHKFGPLKRLKLDRLKNEDEEINIFLTRCISKEIELFFFGINVGKKVFLGYYLDGLKIVLPKVLKEVYFCWVVVEEGEVAEVLKATRGVERVVFNSCKVSIPPLLDLTVQEPYKTKYLSFRWSGSRDWHTDMDWDKHPERLEYLLIAISNCTLQNSLETLNVYKCKITVEQVEELCLKHSLEEVTVVDEDHCVMS
ncbi:unnamed protein product [Moneuplotes crassus]|uniref:Uncharacterized protein n=1 Tax=Euplotes crassus TaxID=5936 RepID=A0AAD1UI20_EUPCR|nr:unnamed protein product [Moneuplotes crassus]